MIKDKFKIKTNSVVYDYYKKTNSLNKCVKVCEEMLKSKNSNPLIRGELAEVILVIALEDYIKRNKLEESGWFISKGLCLKDLDNTDSGYLTELDVTLFTPKKIFLFECKSYSGTKILRDPCKLFTEYKGSEKFHLDVFEQHRKHFEALSKCFNRFRLPINSKFKPYKIVFFDFSKGELKDERSNQMKSLFPVKNINNLYSLFETYNKEPIQWDMRYVERAVKVLESSKDRLTTSHLDYVTNLARKRSHK